MIKNKKKRKKEKNLTETGSRNDKQVIRNSKQWVVNNKKKEQAIKEKNDKNKL